MKKQINILGIETSCDETAAAVVADGSIVRSSVIASQIKLHEKYGGVVPEIASRAHLENIYPVIDEAITKSGLKPTDIDAIAVASHPGLSVALVVGITAAKALSFIWSKPLISVNHIHCHLQSAILNNPDITTPAVGLIVSGGHTSLYNCKSPLDFELLGSTIDDAAGEAFDKVASILKLPYPGGPNIEKLAEQGNPKAILFPRSMMGKDNLNFSFSGLKTAVLYHCCGQDMKAQSTVNQMTQQQIADIAASFQDCVVRVLTKKTKLAAEKTKAKSILLGGGVAANTALRKSFENMCNKGNFALYIAEKKLCTDNGVMIAALGWHKYKAGILADLSLEAAAAV